MIVLETLGAILGMYAVGLVIVGFTVPFKR